MLTSTGQSINLYFFSTLVDITGFNSTPARVLRPEDITYGPEAEPSPQKTRSNLCLENRELLGQ